MSHFTIRQALETLVNEGLHRQRQYVRVLGSIEGLRVERLYLDQTERPVEWATSTYRRDQYKYRIDLAPRSDPGGLSRRKGVR